MRPFPLIVAAGALGIAAAAAPAAVAWGPPQRASTGPGDARAPDVAVNAGGDAVAAWVQEGPDGRGAVVASAARAGLPWSAPERVSPPGMAAADPAVGVTPGGRAIVVWRQASRARVLRGRRQAVYVARARERAAGGRWGPQWVLSDPRQKIGEPQVAVDGRGVAVAAWHWGTGTRAGTPGHVGQIQVSEKPVARGWSRARRVSTDRGCALDTRLPRVAAGAGGHAVVWWQCDLPGGRGGARAIGRGPSPAAWGAERPLPLGGAGDLLADVAVDPGGVIVAAGSGARGELELLRGAAPVGAPGGLRLAPLALSAPQAVARGGGRPSVAAGTGGAVAAWIAPGGLRLADEVAGAPARVGAPAGPPAARRDARIAAAPAGAAVALAPAATGLVATSRAAGRDWAPLERISPAGRVADAEIAATDAVATAYWSRRAGGRSVIERAELRLAP
jgi:hypothetical protein